LAQRYPQNTKKKKKKIITVVKQPIFWLSNSSCNKAKGPLVLIVKTTFSFL
jgi:hypothetical protein